MIIHASCVEFDDYAVVIRGESGRGKSELVWRVIEQGIGRLVADDQLILKVVDEQLRGSAPHNLAGLIEIHGLGLLNVPYVQTAKICLCVDLVDACSIVSMPPRDYEHIAGVYLPRLNFDMYGLGAPEKLRLAVQTIGRHGFPSDNGLLIRN